MMSSLPNGAIRAAALLAALLACRAAGAGLELQCAWTASATSPHAVHVEMTPAVADLDGDGATEIVAVTFPARGDGILRILSGADCSERAAVASLGCRPCAGSTGCVELDRFDGYLALAEGIAVGDLEGDGRLEILALQASRRRVLAFDADGAFLWCSEEARDQMMFPALADLDGDGRAEVLAGSAAFDAGGTLLWEDDAPMEPGPVAADLDGDTALEVVSGRAALRADGSVLWRRADLDLPAPPAVLDLDGDGGPEIVMLAGGIERFLHVLDAGGATLATLRVPFAGGAPAVGDTDGDGTPEIVLAFTRDLLQVDLLPGPWGPASLAIDWRVPIEDASSSQTAATLFDLDGDGAAEILHRDERHLRVVSGDGVILHEVPTASATGWERPVVADVDGDCEAEIVVGADSSLPVIACCEVGVQVWADPQAGWAPARAIDNQYSYHVTNILDDGRIPAVERAPADLGFGYRAQSGPLAPDPAGAPVEPSVLWPPRHDLVPVRLPALTGPLGGSWPLRVVAVRQDEPVEALGDGRFEPDAFLVEGRARLRSERSGLGDGRVYHLEVRAGPGNCGPSADLQVCVPHSRAEGESCGDQGALFDSTPALP